MMDVATQKEMQKNLLKNGKTEVMSDKIVNHFGFNY